MTDNTADCHHGGHGGHGAHPGDETCSCACHGVLGRQAEETDPWEPGDPDEFPAAGALLAYWDLANSGGQSQRHLVGDPWRLWRLARDLATALKGACPDSHQPHVIGRLPFHGEDLWCCQAHAAEAGAQ